MATKAESFRYWEQRAGPDKPRQASRRRRDVGADTSQPGVSDTDRRAGTALTAHRSPGKRADKNALYPLEASAEFKRSRKSSRGSVSHMKPGHPRVTAKREGVLRDSLRARARGRRG